MKWPAENVCACCGDQTLAFDHNCTVFQTFIGLHIDLRFSQQNLCSYNLKDPQMSGTIPPFLHSESLWCRPWRTQFIDGQLFECTRRIIHTSALSQEVQNFAGTCFYMVKYIKRMVLLRWAHNVTLSAFECYPSKKRISDSKLLELLQWSIY